MDIFALAVQELIREKKALNHRNITRYMRKIRAYLKHGCGV